MSDTYNYDSSTRKTTGPKTTVHVGKSTLPSPLIHTKEPSYVTVNADGTFAFLYVNDVSASSTFGSASSTAEFSAYVTGSLVFSGSQAGGPIKLDIQPRAWRRTDTGLTGTVGDVTFVYKGGN